MGTTCVSSRLHIALVSALSFTALAGAAKADLALSGSEGFGWQALPLSRTGGSGTSLNRPFWDDKSTDGRGSRNTGPSPSAPFTGGVASSALPTPSLRPRRWGAPAAEGASSLLLALDHALSLTANRTVPSRLRPEVVSCANRNELGRYRLGSLPGEELLSPIFRAPDSAGTTVVFDTAGALGLYLNNAGGQLFFTESVRNRTSTDTDKQIQHFAIFASSLALGSQNYFIGVEDLARANTDIEEVGDYNDMIFTISAIPAQASTLLLGVSLAAIGRPNRRKKTA